MFGHNFLTFYTCVLIYLILNGECNSLSMRTIHKNHTKENLIDESNEQFYKPQNEMYTTYDSSEHSENEQEEPVVLISDPDNSIEENLVMEKKDSFGKDYKQHRRHQAARWDIGKSLLLIYLWASLYIIKLCANRFR
jgi:hypothetical protein